VRRRACARQGGGTLIHFSTQPEPFRRSLKPPVVSHDACSASSRKVDEREGLPLDHFSAQPEAVLRTEPTANSQRISHKVVASSREVDE
jgi:hypothetical protein